MKFALQRNSRGATLAVVAALAIIIIIIGVGLFLLSRLLGGARELQTATDSGALNVGKQSIVRPNTALTGSEASNFGLLTDVVDGNKVVDLKVYDRLVGQALLVAMNAESDGTQAGMDNAATLFDQLQGDNGIGNRLANALGATSAGSNAFNPTGLANSLRMLDGAALQFNSPHYVTGYMEQRPTDVGATNLTAPSADQTPTVPNLYSLPANYLTTEPANNQRYVRGYTALTFNLGAKGNRVLMGVPTQPGNQPHLVAYQDFNQQVHPPAVAGQTIHVPPNAFQAGSEATTAVTRKLADANARSIIGVLGAQYPPQIPGGYLIVQNGRGVNYTGTEANFTTVLNGQLDGGITVDRQRFFSSDPTLIARWAAYNAHPFRRTQPPLTDLYTRQGDQATLAEARTIRNGPTIRCSDHNTHADTAGGGNPVCDNMLPSFERAYSPGFNGSYQQPVAGTSTNLTAIEGLKADLEHLFNHCGVLRPSNSLTSGMRFYKYNCIAGALGDPPRPSANPLDCPWPQNATPSGDLNSNFPQISSDGTLTELISLATGDPSGRGTGRARTPVNEYRAFLKQRLAEISGKNSQTGLDADVTYVMNQAKYPMGVNTYIYYSYPPNGAPQIQVTAVAPPSLNPQAPDGNPIPLHHDYPGIIGTKVNSTNEHYVDKNPFQRWSGNITAREMITLQPSSGFNNLLGTISLEEQAIMARNPYFCEPD